MIQRRTFRKRNSLAAGSRGSELALAQTRIVVDLLKKRNPGLEVEIREITTIGDGSGVNTPNLTGKDSFTREIDLALKNGAIDFAVHSLKDVPTQGYELGINSRSNGGIEIAAYPKRGSPYDALISRNGEMTLDSLPRGARIGTSSVRRAMQLKFFRPDFEIVEIHGNVPTRIQKLRNIKSKLDAIILAKAGLDRLHIEEQIDEVIKSSKILPAVGQGCLAVSVSSDDYATKNLIKKINDEETSRRVRAERVFSSELGGGCNTPIAALARIRGSRLFLDGLLFVERRDKNHLVLRASIEGEKRNATQLGKKLAARIKAMIVG